MTKKPTPLAIARLMTKPREIQTERPEPPELPRLRLFRILRESLKMADVLVEAHALLVDHGVLTFVVYEQQWIPQEDHPDGGQWIFQAMQKRGFNVWDDYEEVLTAHQLSESVN